MKKHFGIVVGGGPAPGINGVVGAATIEAINRGYRVFGIQNGFSKISEGDLSCLSELTIDTVSRIQGTGGSVLGTSRANPKRNPKHLQNIVRLLEKQGIQYLITIGGDDTASTARAIEDASGGALAVVHVPKTIDNDLPLPEFSSTFGFQTARAFGTEVVETLMEDAKTTGRWYLVVAMGRKAGHLALGIGVSAGATLCVIPEEFEHKTIPLSKLVNILAGSIIKRQSLGRSYGVAVLAEGLAEILDSNSLPELADIERDPHGNIRFSEIDFGKLIKNAVKERLQELGVKGVRVVDSDVGYELRCRAPNPFDREYTRELGYGAVDYLEGGGSAALMTRQGDNLVPVPFEDLVDQETGNTKIRLVDTSSTLYRVARKYMIRLSEEDFTKAKTASQIASVTNCSPEKLHSELFGEQ